MKAPERRGGGGAGEGQEIPGDHPQGFSFGSGLRRRGKGETLAPAPLLDAGGPFPGDHPEAKGCRGGRAVRAREKALLSLFGEWERGEPRPPSLPGKRSPLNRRRVASF